MFLRCVQLAATLSIFSGTLFGASSVVLPNPVFGVLGGSNVNYVLPPTTNSPSYHPDNDPNFVDGNAYFWYEKAIVVPGSGTRIDWLWGSSPANRDLTGTNYGADTAGGKTAFNPRYVTQADASYQPVRSYFLWADLLGGGSLSGSITFTLPVLGIIAQNYDYDLAVDGVQGNLNQSNPYYGYNDPVRGATNYNGANRSGSQTYGMDQAQANDWIWISADRRTVNFSFVSTGSNSRLDSLRFLVATPEPATWLLFITLVVPLLFVRKTRKNPSKA
jgi:hypothetical protein